MPFADLPFRREHLATTSNETQPEELKRYFADLQDFFARHVIADLQKHNLTSTVNSPSRNLPAIESPLHTCRRRKA
jgi:hypothetical protein